MYSVLITGARSGIGKATAAAFSNAGHLVVAAVRTPQGAADLDEIVQAANGRMKVVVADVANDASVASGLAEASAFAGPPDIVVNNAGIADSGPVETIEWERARRVFETNLWGAVRVTRASLAAMRARGSGLIVNVTSIGARTPARGYHGFYMASKHALLAISEALAWEVEPFGIRVVSLEPGFVETGIFERAGFQEAIDPASPYAGDEAWVRRFYLEGRRAGVSPAFVAERIVALAEERHPALHQLVGDDAVAAASAVATAVDFETWTRAAQDRVATLAGPRPLRFDPIGIHRTVEELA